MIIDYIDIENNGKPGITTILYDNFDSMVKKYVIGHDRYYISERHQGYVDYDCCLGCWIKQREFNISMFDVEQYGFIRQLRNDLISILQEKQNKIILEVIEGNWIEDINKSIKDIDTCFDYEESFNYAEIVHDIKSSKLNRLSVLRNWIGNIREQILEDEDYFRNGGKAMWIRWQKKEMQNAKNK
jgi:hypothetical protein